MGFPQKGLRVFDFFFMLKNKFKKNLCLGFLQLDCKNLIFIGNKFVKFEELEYWGFVIFVE